MELRGSQGHGMPCPYERMEERASLKSGSRAAALHGYEGKEMRL
ncbi:MAG: hypothetical protein NVS9B4_23220 [Candidatus Acidiferrum sp.]